MVTYQINKGNEHFREKYKMRHDTSSFMGSSIYLLMKYNSSFHSQPFPKIKIYWTVFNWPRLLNIIEPMHFVPYESVQKSACLVLRKLLTLLVVDRETQCKILFMECSSGIIPSLTRWWTLSTKVLSNLPWGPVLSRCYSRRLLEYISPMGQTVLGLF